MSWPDLLSAALKYLAAGLLVGALGLFAWYGKVSNDLFVSVVVAALSALGVYHTTTGGK